MSSNMFLSKISMCLYFYTYLLIYNLSFNLVIYYLGLFHFCHNDSIKGVLSASSVYFLCVSPSPPPSLHLFLSPYLPFSLILYACISMCECVKNQLLQLLKSKVTKKTNFPAVLLLSFLLFNFALFYQ